PRTFRPHFCSTVHDRRPSTAHWASSAASVAWQPCHLGSSYSLPPEWTWSSPNAEGNQWKVTLQEDRLLNKFTIAVVSLAVIWRHRGRSEGLEQPVAHDVDELCGNCVGAGAAGSRSGGAGLRGGASGGVRGGILVAVRGGVCDAAPGRACNAARGRVRDGRPGRVRDKKPDRIGARGEQGRGQNGPLLGVRTHVAGRSGDRGGRRLSAGVGLGDEGPREVVEESRGEQIVRDHEAAAALPVLLNN